MILSFLRKDIIISFFIASIFMFILALASFNIEKVTCSYDTSWSCYEYSTNLSSIGYLWSGLGIITLFYGLFMAISDVGEDLSKEIKRE
ncbi:MAG: hypothetical protein ACTSVB_07980 [Candidatus Heimdallarchaeaceae archaeon]